MRSNPTTSLPIIISVKFSTVIFLSFKFFIAVLKSKNVVTIAVDNVFGSSGQHGTEKRTDTSHGLFIGGHPYQDRLAGFRTNKESFVGCMRNVLVNDKAINIQEKPAFKGVRYNVCPTN